MLKNTIGDSDPSDGATNAANTIAFNTNDGVFMNPASTGNRILSNSIFDNTRLGIDLGGGTQDANDITANDGDDPTTSKPDPDKDTGPNRLQNYPVLTSAQIVDDPFFGDTTVIEGNLNSTPKKTFTILFFSNPEKDPSEYGEGKTFLGEKQVKTDKQGNASFGFATTQAASEGEFITATATNKTGDTSEFFLARVVVKPPPVIGL